MKFLILRIYRDAFFLRNLFHHAMIISCVLYLDMKKKINQKENWIRKDLEWFIKMKTKIMYNVNQNIVIVKNIQYQGFARGHPPYYWPGSNHLNFRDRTGSGALWLIWPNVTFYKKYNYINLYIIKKKIIIIILIMIILYL